MARKKTSRYIRKLRSKYRLIIYNDVTFAEVWHMRLSRLNVFTFFGLITLIVVAMVVSLIAFTPLRELIPGYPDSKTRRNIVQNAQRLDMLEQKVRRWVLHNDNLSRILSGQEPVDVETAADTAQSNRYSAIMRSYFVEDSLFRLQVEEMEQQNLTVQSLGGSPSSIDNLRFFPPIRGRVASEFDLQNKQLGVSVEAGDGSMVMAALDGVIVSACWTIENGYVVNIQHALNITTVYKNNKQLLKQVGAHVSAGEVIAITGASEDSGTLLFEIWSNGAPVNPEQYIAF
ncbi:MAG: M23 family metallopeptidase [Prevotellaceae bacterium]|jgi:murein DD-endopeptidase MepM/ murein hydrolase activator NlpD|nr:M23 family metallopeptidase [Prevotellaceae bacterium]